MKVFPLIFLIFCLLFIFGLELNAYEINGRAVTEDIYWLAHIDDVELQCFVKNTAEYYEIPMGIAVRLLYTESSFNPNAVRHESNGSYSVGYTQLNSSCFEWFDEKFFHVEYAYGEFDPYNMYHNIIVGFAYLDYLYGRFGSWEDALIAYNAGPARVDNPPMSSIEYSAFIVSGRAAPDSFLYQRAVDFHNLKED